ncbi:MAG: sugar ABC transporter ATP-binding protein [Solirubrobacteraceae bacterium]
MSGTGQAAPASEAAALPALLASNLAKSFGGARALDRVDIAIRAGEVVALLGENGSGKSTLVKILSGYHVPEPGGTLQMNGVDVPLPVPLGQARMIGLSFVYQDLGLASDMQVVENLFVGRRVTAGARSFARIHWSAERRRAREIFEGYGIDLDPSAQTGRLRPTSQALLAIVRAAEELREYRREYEQSGGVLVLDEPTVFLPEHEKVFLFDLVRRVVAEGFGVLFVSHDMTAVREIANRAVVLRDGAKVGDVAVATASDADLIELVSGHRLDRSTIEQATTYGSEATVESSGEVVLSVQDARGGRVRGVSFELHAGEILGIAGLLGGGSEDLPYLLFGDGTDASGRIALPDWSGELSELAPSRAIELGMALVPADRKQQGVVADLPVALNMLSLSLRSFMQSGFLRVDRLVGVADQRAETYDVRPRDASLNMSALSGGNQQKVVLARWLEQNPRVLLLHEPTQGVDVATRHQIYELMRARAADGVAILWVSTDFDELATVSHRILLCARGAIQGTIQPPYSRDRITSEVYSATARGAAREVSTAS